MGTVVSLRWIVIATVSIAALAAGIVVYYAQPSLPGDESEQQAGKKESAIELVVSESKNTSSAFVTPNPYIKEFQLPKDNFPNGILVDSNGTVWTVGTKSQSLISFNPEQQKAISYRIPSGSDGSGVSMVWTMAEGGDGSIWFSGSGKNPLWRFDPQKESFESITALSASPINMKMDEDSGRIWYASLSRGIIGVLQKGGQEYFVKELELGKESFPSGVFIQNQTLWITQSADGKITTFQISSKGGEVVDIVKTAQFPEEMLFSPSDIVINNGSAWVTEHGTSFLTEYNIETQEVKRYPTALHPIQISTLPYWLAEDPSGKGVWFNEHRGNRIAFFDFSSRTLTEYEVPTRNPQMGYIANVLTVAADPSNENRAWFTEWTEDKIGYVDRSVPIPFDIRTPDKQQIVVEKGQTAEVNIEITRNPEVELFNDTLSFNASSSAVSSGFLLNATATFSPSLIDLSETSGTQTVSLELTDNGMQEGKHMLAVSATDGAVVRTVYVELEVK